MNPATVAVAWRAVKILAPVLLLVVGAAMLPLLFLVSAPPATPVEGAPVACTLPGAGDAAAVPVPAAGGGVLSASQVATLVVQAGFPADAVPTAVAIARAESGWNPRATNHNTNGTYDWGLFQINDVNASVLAGGNKFDPLDNAKMAFRIWKSWGNWKAWSTFNSGSYEKFLTATPAEAPGCTPAVTEGAACSAQQGSASFGNGRIPRSHLCPLWANGGKFLRPDAATSFNALSKAYFARFGSKPCVTDAYRSYPEQVDVARRKPGLAAVPGTSNHGWGVAVDLGCGANNPGTEQDVWLHANAGRFGWHHPSWAEPGGSKPEPWHWSLASAKN